MSQDALDFDRQAAVAEAHAHYLDALTQSGCTRIAYAIGAVIPGNRFYAFVPQGDVLQIVFNRDKYRSRDELMQMIVDVVGSGMAAFMQGKVIIPVLPREDIESKAENLALELWHFTRERRLWNVGLAFRRLGAEPFEVSHEADRATLVVNGDLSPVDLASWIRIAQSAQRKLSEPGWTGPIEVIKEGSSDVDWPPRLSADALIPPGCRVEVSVQFETEAGAQSQWYGPFVNPRRQAVEGVPRGYPYISLRIGLGGEAGASQRFAVRGIMCEAEGSRLYYSACLVSGSDPNLSVQGGCLTLVP